MYDDLWRGIDVCMVIGKVENDLKKVRLLYRHRSH